MINKDKRSEKKSKLSLSMHYTHTHTQLKSIDNNYYNHLFLLYQSKEKLSKSSKPT